MSTPSNEHFRSGLRLAIIGAVLLIGLPLLSRVLPNANQWTIFAFIVATPIVVFVLSIVRGWHDRRIAVIWRIPVLLIAIATVSAAIFIPLAASTPGASILVVVVESVVVAALGASVGVGLRQFSASARTVATQRRDRRDGSR